MKAKKLSAKAGKSETTKVVTESAQQVWLAGLGAFARAQQEGAKLFESLVKEGERVQARAQKQLDTGIKAAEGRVEEAKERAGGNFDKLEKVFEQRVARTLTRLGVPSRSDVRALQRQVKRLSEQIEALAQARTAEQPAHETKAKAA